METALTEAAKVIEVRNDRVDRNYRESIDPAGGYVASRRRSHLGRPVLRSGPMLRLALTLGLMSVAVPMAGCSTGVGAPSETLKIGAYSVVREVFHDALVPSFTARWKSQTGRDLQFEESYSGSGAQARSIASGFDADLTVLSHAADMEV